MCTNPGGPCRPRARPNCSPASPMVTDTRWSVPPPRPPPSAQTTRPRVRAAPSETSADSSQRLRPPTGQRGEAAARKPSHPGIGNTQLSRSKNPELVKWSVNRLFVHFTPKCTRNRNLLSVDQPLQQFSRMGFSLRTAVNRRICVLHLLHS